MEKIVLKYNSKRIFGFIIIGFLLLLLSIYGLLNAKKLSLKEPSTNSISRYRWIGELVYNNEKLIFIVSLLFCFFLLIVLLNLLTKLSKKEFLIWKSNNKIFFENDQIGNIENIQSIQIVNYKYNSWVYIYLKETSEILDSKKSIFQKMIYSVRFYFNKNALSINLSLFEGGSSEAFEKIREITENHKRKK